IKNYIFSSLNSRLQEALENEILAEHILRKCNDLKRLFEPRHPGLLILDRCITIRENVRRRRPQEEEEFIFDFEMPPVIMPATPTADLITPASTPSAEFFEHTVTPSDVPYTIHINNENMPPITPITPNTPTDFTADFLPFTARRLFDEAIQDDTEEREILEEAAQQPMEFSFDADDVDDVDFIPFGPVSPEEAYEYVVAPHRYKRGYEYAKEINVDLRDVTNEDLFGELKECELCYDRNCSVKTGCGHDFCSVCVRKIINEKKDTTVAPSCSYCRKAFEQFTTNSPFTYAILCDYIEHMII
ncbi:MAG: hypothetical protein EB127_19445, partial [Alphaproteobacteria bacterium]|nr:hypothetical protein [Alphaproteobacteria bacterium]